MPDETGLTVLVGVDFSGSTRAIISATSRLLRLAGGHVYLVHVAEPEPEFVGLDVGPEAVRESLAAEFRAEHRQLQQLKDQDWPQGVDVTALLVQGPTAETLLAEQRRLGADLVVLGSFGHGRLRDALMGSTASNVLRAAKCPVLVVPPRPD